MRGHTWSGSPAGVGGTGSGAAPGAEQRSARRPQGSEVSHGGRGHRNTGATVGAGEVYLAVWRMLDDYPVPFVMIQCRLSRYDKKLSE